MKDKKKIYIIEKKYFEILFDRKDPYTKDLGLLGITENQHRNNEQLRMDKNFREIKDLFKEQIV